MTERPDLTTARARVEEHIAAPGSGSPHTPAPPGIVTVRAVLLIVLDFAGIVAAGVSGHFGILIGCVVLLVLIASVSIGRYRTLQATTLQWQSGQAWAGALGRSPQRGLVDAAAEAAPRVTDTPASELRLELDRVDAYAHHIARARQQSAEACATAWEAVVDRVAALTAYADALAASEKDRMQSLTPLLARPLPDP